MTKEEVLATLKELVSVTSQRIYIAGKYLRSRPRECEIEAKDVFEGFAKEMAAQRPAEINIHHSQTPLIAVKQLAEALSWELALSEALWIAVRNGILIGDLNSGAYVPSSQIDYTSIFGRSGGSGSGITFTAFTQKVYRKFEFAPSYRLSGDPVMVETGTLLGDLGDLEENSEIRVALNEACACLRYELFLASIAMLGKASEGLWMEAGMALAAVKALNTERANKLTETLQSPYSSVSKKIKVTLDAYESSELSDLRKASGVSMNDLRNSQQWSDAVRDGRNSIHYDVASSVPNSYEKVTALLLCATNHVKVLQTVKAAALKAASG